MRKYEVYRNIRKGALIWGLPISLFALFIVSIVGSLLIIIFSFNLIMIIALLIWNCALFIGLGRSNEINKLIALKSIFPKSISNRKPNILDHVEY